MGAEYAGPGWTDERKELLKKLYATGLSASQIAKQLGGVSRNAVIGKLHRMGMIQERTASAPSKIKRPPTPAPRPVRVEARPPPPPIVIEPIPAGELTPIPEAERHPHFCRWPIGDPMSPAFDYCGREQGFLTDSTRRDPYCPHHRAAERARAKQPRSDVTKLAGWIDKMDNRRVGTRRAAGEGNGQIA